MDQQPEISDPSDWTNTSLQSLYPLDSNLRCLICKDFYTAPVMTTCLHTFCSLCIRRSLSSEAVCPACRTTNISDSGLRQNKVVADLVENFVSVRPRLLEIARREGKGESIARNIPGNASGNTSRNTSRNTVGTASKVQDVPPSDASDEEDVIEIQRHVIRRESPVRQLRQIQPMQKSGISCPICQRPFKSAEQVDLHIDTCTGPPPNLHPVPHATYNLRPQRPAPPSLVPVPSASTASSAFPSNPPSKASHTLTPLPKLNYAMYNDKTLRSILNDLGLPTYGNRNLLSARHKEYVNLHNANIDRRQPLPQKDLLRELSRWDSTQAQIMSSSRGEKRRFDGGEWEERCKDEFAELARRARESAKRKKIVREEKEGAKSSQEIVGTNGTIKTNGMDGTDTAIGMNATMDGGQVKSSQISSQEHSIA